jgi:hypothetical protein
MKKLYLSAVLALAAFVIAGGMLTKWLVDHERLEQRHYEREETELIVSNLTGARIQLYKAGKNLSDGKKSFRHGENRRIRWRANLAATRQLFFAGHPE